MCRKQPIPVSFLNNNNLTILDKMLFSYLWSMTRNEDWCVNFINWNKHISQELKRWQVILIAKHISDSLSINRKNISKSIKRIGKWENEMHITRKSYWSIITWIWYDERVKMDIKRDIKGTSREHQENIVGTSINKSVKSEENVKSENNKNLFKKFRELYPIKKWKWKAEKKYNTAVKKWTSQKKIIEWVKKYIDENKALKKNNKFCPEYKHPATRLYQKCRNDEYEVDIGLDIDFDTIYQCFKDWWFRSVAVKKKYPDFYKEKYTEDYRQQIIKRMNSDMDFFWF